MNNWQADARSNPEKLDEKQISLFTVFTEALTKKKTKS